jgi:hypothetical protein
MTTEYLISSSLIPEMLIDMTHSEDIAALHFNVLTLNCWYVSTLSIILYFNIQSVISSLFYFTKNCRALPFGFGSIGCRQKNVRIDKLIEALIEAENLYDIICLQEV